MNKLEKYNREQNKKAFGVGFIVFVIVGFVYFTLYIVNMLFTNLENKFIIWLLLAITQYIIVFFPAFFLVRLFSDDLELIYKNMGKMRLRAFIEYLTELLEKWGKDEDNLKIIDEDKKGLKK